jgi:hypothetical protein
LIEHDLFGKTATHFSGSCSDVTGKPMLEVNGGDFPGASALKAAARDH